MRLPPLALLFLATVAGADAADEERALARVRVLEGELEEVIARVAPAVGAVLRFGVQIDPATGRVALVPSGQGSGLIITREGLLLTNVHVVEDGARLTVALNDGSVHEARLHADTSEGQVKGDIALLQLQGDRFPFVDWQKGSSSALKPGDFVFAMGNPYGHAEDGVPVATLGIVSGKGRSPSEAGYLYIDALQTDAEINPGNSGGPLFDSSGRLVGMNGLMASRQGGSNSGVGWAIPIDQMRLFLKDLTKKKGEGVSYGYLGLEVESLPDESGVKVTRRLPGSPARDIEVGAVITTVNGKKVRNRTDFVNLVGKLPERAVVSMAFYEGRKFRTTRFRLESFTAVAVPREGGGERQPLSPSRRGYLGAQWEVTPAGLRVTRTTPGTDAEEKLRPGDVLRRIASLKSSWDAHSPQALLEALTLHSPGETVVLDLLRAGNGETVPLTLCDCREAAGA
ncbi:MAG: trypsin-like peptidase domain-containing protein [Planctomycetaceae bacterium]